MEAIQPPADAASLVAERDAVRIQAAAVAAQQAQLTEIETQLNQRRDALEQRERQIAAHLEDRQSRLLELREEVKQERGVLEEERDTFEAKKAALQGELGKARKQAVRERRRFTEARKRFKQRWLAYTAEKQTSLHQREQQLLAGQQKFQKEVDAYQRERTQFNDVRLRLNGEMEVGRRELKAAWEELALANQQWDEALNVEHRDREQRLRSLAAREAAVAAGERHLAAENQTWRDGRARLFQETEGLETRIRNQRYQLQELRRPPTAVTVYLPAPPLAPPQPVPLSGSVHELPELPGIVQRLAGHLVDQRWLLLEHWARFIHVDLAWQQERAALLADLEATERRCAARELQLDGREKSLEELEADLERRQERLGRTRAELESFQTRLTLREVNWAGECTAILGAAEAREQTATALVRQLDAVRQRRQECRRREVVDLRQARAQCEAIRQQYLALIHRFQERQAELALEQQSLTARTVAVERFRLELLNRSPDAPAAEKRLEKLRQRTRARLEAAERKVTAQRQTLLAESRRLEERTRQLHQREDELTTLQDQVARREAEWERAQSVHEQAELPRQRELRLLKTQHENDARQLAALRDEVDRVARLLLDGPEAPLVNQAA